MRSWVLRAAGGLAGLALLPACDLQESKNVYGAPAGVSIPVLPPSAWTFVQVEAIVDGGVPRFVGVADLDGDLVEDLVLGRASGAGEVTVYLGISAGVFPGSPSSSVALPAGTRAGVLADLDDDDLPDLLVGTFNGAGGGRLVLRRGQGDGTFDGEEDLAVQDTLFLALGDFDGNGTPDVAAGDGVQTGIYLNTGGTLTLVQLIPESGPIVCGDLDPSPGDEVAGTGSGQVRLYVDLFGSAAVAATLPFPGAQQATSILVADADGDLDLDLIASTSDGASGGRAVLFRGSGAGLESGTSLLIGAAADRAAMADVDGDGFRDLVLARNGALTLGTAMGEAGGGFVETSSESPLAASLILLRSGPASGGRGSLLLATSAGFFLGWAPPAP